MPATKKSFSVKSGLDANANSISNLGASSSSLALSGGHSVVLTTGGATTLTLPINGTLLYDGGALGTPASGNLSNCTFPTLNQNTTGYSSNLAGGNNTTLLGALPYQSAANTTTLLSPNTTTTKKFLRMTGTGTNGAAPAWDTLVASDVPTLNQNTTGSAATLTTPRAINGVNFDGSAAITVTAAAGTLTGATLNSSVTGSSLTSLGTLTSLSVSNSTVSSWTSTMTSGTLGGTAGNQVLVQRLTNNNGNINYLEITDTRTATGSDWTTAGTRIQEKVDSTWMGFIQFNGNGNNGGITFGTGTTTVSATSISERLRIDSSGNVYPVASNTYNLGGASNLWATVYATTFNGTATIARYADLAENYTSDQNYDYGTVLMIGGEKEVTIADADTQRLAGVVSQNPAYLMNSACEGEYVVAIALQGRTPVRVKGKVNKGDFLVSAGDGYAKATDNPKIGSIIGKSLESFDGQYGMVEVMVGRL